MNKTLTTEVMTVLTQHNHQETEHVFIAPRLKPVLSARFFPLIVFLSTNRCKQNKFTEGYRKTTKITPPALRPRLDST